MSLREPTIPTAGPRYALRFEDGHWLHFSIADKSGAPIPIRKEAYRWIGTEDQLFRARAKFPAIRSLTVVPLTASMARNNKL